jgi:hypothetical protein
MKGDASTFSLIRQAEDREGEVFSFYGVHADRCQVVLFIVLASFVNMFQAAFSSNQQRVHCG